MASDPSDVRAFPGQPIVVGDSDAPTYALETGVIVIHGEGFTDNGELDQGQVWIDCPESHGGNIPRIIEATQHWTNSTIDIVGSLPLHPGNADMDPHSDRLLVYRADQTPGDSVDPDNHGAYGTCRVYIRSAPNSTSGYPPYSH